MRAMTSRGSSSWRKSSGTMPYRSAGSTAGGSGVASVQGGIGARVAEVADDLARERERVLVGRRVVVGDAGAARVDVGAAELLGRDVLAGRRLHERRAADEDRARARTITVSSLIAGT